MSRLKRLLTRLSGSNPSWAGSVPAFPQRDYPQKFVPKSLDRQQRTFFSHLMREVDHGRYPDIQGNVCYLYIYAAGILGKWRDLGFEWVYKRVLDLGDAYESEREFATLCRRWSLECLLGMKRFDQFLLLTEPEDIFLSRYANVRCNVCHVLDRPPTAVDLMNISQARVTTFTRRHPAAFSDLLEGAVAEDADRNGPWLERLLAARDAGARATEKDHKLYMFGGVYPLELTAPPEAPFPYHEFGAMHEYLQVIRAIVRHVENQLRDVLSVPRIGEGWVAETALYHAVRDAFPGTGVIQHGRPVWLGLQHFDIWIPAWKIAMEYHGEQHFRPVDHFGSTAGFHETAERDERKRQLCAANGVRLIIATEQDSHASVIDQIRRARASRANAGQKGVGLPKSAGRETSAGDRYWA